MAAEGKSGLLGSTQAFCILTLFLLLFSAWSSNFSPHEGTLVDLTYGEQTKRSMFGCDTVLCAPSGRHSTLIAAGIMARRHLSQAKCVRPKYF